MIALSDKQLLSANCRRLLQLYYSHTEVKTRMIHQRTVALALVLQLLATVTAWPQLPQGERYNALSQLQAMAQKFENQAKLFKAEIESLELEESIPPASPAKGKIAISA